MSHIAVFLHAAQGGGAERAMINLANEFAKCGVKTDLVFAREGGPLRSEVAGGVNVIDLSAAQVRWALLKLHRYISTAKPDCLISALPSTDFLAVLGKRFLRWPCRLVVSVQNNPTATAHGSSELLERNWPRIMKLFYSSADQLVAISAGVADEVRSVMERGDLSIPVIYNPLAIDRISSMKDAQPDHPWFCDGGDPVIIAVGRLTPQKDYPTMLRAFAALQSRRAARLVIAGEGELRGELEALARKLGVADRIAFVGFIANPFAAMRAADLFVLSSKWEGFANVVAEALACGARVVSTDCPSGPGEILDDGAYGILSQVGDVEALARAMDEGLRRPHDPEQLMARAQDFAVGPIAQQYLQLAAPLTAAAE